MRSCVVGLVDAYVLKCESLSVPALVWMLLVRFDDRGLQDTFGFRNGYFPVVMHKPKSVYSS